MNKEFKIKCYPFAWQNFKCIATKHDTDLPNFTWKGWHFQIFNFSIWYGQYLTQRDDLILPPNEREELKHEIKALKETNEHLLEEIKNRATAVEAVTPKIIA